MKLSYKLFHLGTLVVFGILLSSCTKDEMVRRNEDVSIT